MLQWHPGAVAESDGGPSPTMPWKPPSNALVGSQEGDRRVDSAILTS